jgi:hypothetical protein
MPVMMMDYLLLSLRGLSIFIAILWAAGFVMSKLSKNLVQFPGPVALLCGYPRRGGYVNLQGACLQMDALLLPFVMSACLLAFGKGQTTLMITMIAGLVIPMLLYRFLSQVTQRVDL